MYLFTSQNHDSRALDFSAFNVKLNSVLYTFPVVSTLPFRFRSIEYSVLLLINMNWEILECWIGGGWILSKNVNRNRRIDCAHLLHTIIAYRVTSRRLQSPFHLLLIFRQTEDCQHISSTLLRSNKRRMWFTWDQRPLVSMCIIFTVDLTVFKRQQYNVESLPHKIDNVSLNKNAFQ